MVALVTERLHSPSQAALRAEENADLDQKHISEVAARETYQQELSAQRRHNAITSTAETKEQSEPSTQFSDTIRERQSELREVVKNTNSLITGNERNIKNIENTVAQ